MSRAGDQLRSRIATRNAQQQQPVEPEGSENSPGFIDGARDLGTGVLAGGIGTAQALSGLASYIPGAERPASAIYRGLGRAREGVLGLQSEHAQQARGDVHGAWDSDERFGTNVGNVLSGIRDNPYYLTSALGETLGSFGGYGKALKLAQGSARFAGLTSPAQHALLAGGLGAGGAGGEIVADQAEDAPYTDRLAGLGAGAVYAGTGWLGTRLTGGLDPNVIAGRLMGANRTATPPSQAGLWLANRHAAIRYPSHMAIAGTSEGLQEFAQSGSDVLFANIGLRKEDIWEGVDKAAVIGSISGAVGGGAMGVIGGRMDTKARNILATETTEKADAARTKAEKQRVENNLAKLSNSDSGAFLDGFLDSLQIDNEAKSRIKDTVARRGLPERFETIKDVAQLFDAIAPNGDQKDAAANAATNATRSGVVKSMISALADGNNPQAQAYAKGFFDVAGGKAKFGDVLSKTLNAIFTNNTTQSVGQLHVLTELFGSVVDGFTEGALRASDERKSAIEALRLTGDADVFNSAAVDSDRASAVTESIVDGLEGFSKALSVRAAAKQKAHDDVVQTQANTTRNQILANLVPRFFPKLTEDHLTDIQSRLSERPVPETSLDILIDVEGIAADGTVAMKATVNALRDDSGFNELYTKVLSDALNIKELDLSRDAKGLISTDTLNKGIESLRQKRDQLRTAQSAQKTAELSTDAVTAELGVLDRQLVFADRLRKSINGKNIAVKNARKKEARKRAAELEAKLQATLDAIQAKAFAAQQAEALADQQGTQAAIFEAGQEINRRQAREAEDASWAAKNKADREAHKANVAREDAAFDAQQKRLEQTKADIARRIEESKLAEPNEAAYQEDIENQGQLEEAQLELDVVQKVRADRAKQAEQALNDLYDAQEQASQYDPSPAQETAQETAQPPSEPVATSEQPPSEPAATSEQPINWDARYKLNDIAEHGIPSSTQKKQLVDLVNDLGVNELLKSESVRTGFFTRSDYIKLLTALASSVKRHPGDFEAARREVEQTQKKSASESHQKTDPVELMESINSTNISILRRKSATELHGMLDALGVLDLLGEPSGRNGDHIKTDYYALMVEVKETIAGRAPDNAADLKIEIINARNDPSRNTIPSDATANIAGNQIANIGNLKTWLNRESKAKLEQLLKDLNVLDLVPKKYGKRTHIKQDYAEFIRAEVYPLVGLSFDGHRTDLLNQNTAIRDTKIKGSQVRVALEEASGKKSEGLTPAPINQEQQLSEPVAEQQELTEEQLEAQRDQERREQRAAETRRMAEAAEAGTVAVDQRVERQQEIEDLFSDVDDSYQDINDPYRRAEPPETQVDANDAVEVVNQVLRSLPNAPPVKIVQNRDSEQLPQTVRDAFGDANVRAVFHNGEVYVNVAMHGDTTDVARSVYHEVVGHYGLRAILGDALNATLDALAEARPMDTAFFAQKYVLDMALPNDRRIAAEEMLAASAEQLATDGFLNDIINRLKAWWADLTGQEFTDAQIIRDFIKPAQGFTAAQKYAATNAADQVTRYRNGQQPSPTNGPNLNDIAVAASVQTKDSLMASAAEMGSRLANYLRFTRAMLQKLEHRLPSARKLRKVWDEQHNLSAVWERNHQIVAQAYARLKPSELERVSQVLLHHSSQNTVPELSKAKRLAYNITPQGLQLVEIPIRASDQTIDPSRFDQLNDREKDAVRLTQEMMSELQTVETKMHIDHVNEAINKLRLTGTLDAAAADKLLGDAVGAHIKRHNKQITATYVPQTRRGEQFVVAKSQEYLDIEQTMRENDEPLSQHPLRQDKKHYQYIGAANEYEAKKIVKQLTPDFADVLYQRKTVAESEYGLSLSELTQLYERLGAEAQTGDDLKLSLSTQVEQEMLKIVDKLIREGDSVIQSRMQRDNIPGIRVSEIAPNVLDRVRDFGFAYAASRTASQRFEAIRGMRQELKHLSGSESVSYTKTFDSLMARMGNSNESSSFGNQLAGKALSISAFTFLLSNPSYYALQLMQTWMMTAPTLAGEFGTDAVTKLGQHYSTIMPHLTKAARHGEIEIVFESMTYDSHMKKLLAGRDPTTLDAATLQKYQQEARRIDEQRNLLRELQARNSLDVGMSQEVGVNQYGIATGTASKVMRWAYNLARAMEIVNRGVSGLAAYDLRMDQLLKGRDIDSLPAQEKADLIARATDYADNIVYNTHGNYSFQDAAGAFRNPAMRVVMQFKKIALFQGRLLYDTAKKGWIEPTLSVKGITVLRKLNIERPIVDKIVKEQFISDAEHKRLHDKLVAFASRPPLNNPLTPSEFEFFNQLINAELNPDTFVTSEMAQASRASFRYLLGTAGLITGTTSIPFATAGLAMALRQLGDDEDEHKYSTNESVILDTFGLEMGNFILRGGASSLVGVDVSSRIGINFVDHLFGSVYNNLSVSSGDESARDVIFGLAGPTASLAGDLLEGAKYLQNYGVTGSNRDLLKAAQSAMPLGVRNAIQAHLWDREGVVNNSGVQLIAPEAFSDAQVMRKRFGLQPSMMSEFYALRQSKTQIEEALGYKRLLLKRTFYQSQLSGDEALRDYVMEQWRELNEDQRRLGFVPNPTTELTQYVRQKMREQNRVVGGMATTSRNRDMTRRQAILHGLDVPYFSPSSAMRLERAGLL